MSELKVGTLVMLVNVGAESGKVGEIVSPLAMHRTWAIPDGAMHYGVRLSEPSGWRGGDGLPKNAFAIRPQYLIPLTPPGRADDVTTDEPIKEDATC
jgi:hypothetical protein